VLLSPTLSVYYDAKEADGFYGSLGVSHSLELTDAASLSLAASIGAADDSWTDFYYGEDTGDGLNDYSVSASVPFAVNDSITITPGVTYASLLGDAEDAVDDSGDALYFGDTDAVVGSLKASFAF
jgi:outer membrane scaffolding protein for murein synthesis (MipA/OmpV family)